MELETDVGVDEVIIEDPKEATLVVAAETDGDIVEEPTEDTGSATDELGVTEAAEEETSEDKEDAAVIVVVEGTAIELESDEEGA